MKKMILGIALIGAMASCSKDQIECECIVQDQEMENNVWRTYSTYRMFRNSNGNCDDLDKTEILAYPSCIPVINVGQVCFGGHREIIDCGI